MEIAALKQNREQEKQDRYKDIDDCKRVLQQRIKELENELKEEQKYKQQGIQQRKQVEIEVQNVRQQTEEVNRVKEEALRTNRRLQVNKTSLMNNNNSFYFNSDPNS